MLSTHRAFSSATLSRILSMPNSKEPPHPLEPVLRDAEAELRRRLREACDAESDDVTNDSVAEIRRLEDTLLKAAVAAGQTAALRRHIARTKSPNEEPSDRPAAAEVSKQERPADEEAPAVATPRPVVGSVREFRDANGRMWRAWPVVPGSARSGRHTEQYLGDFHKGWVCFESLESSARRRLPQQQPRWSELDDRELANLLEQAISAPERRKFPNASLTRPDRGH
jgi:hypothetical protein